MGGSGPAVVGIGNALVDHTYEVTALPGPDEGAYVLDHAERPGGVEANVTTALAHLGHGVGLIARLGDEPRAERLVDRLDGAGIDTDRIRLEPGDTSSYCLVLRNPEGERAIIGGGDSALRLRLDEADVRYVARSDVAFTSGYASPAVLRTLSERAPPGVSLVFDLAGRFEDLRHRGFNREDVDDAASAIDLFVANEAAARSYLQCPSEAVVSALRERGFERGAITRGADGATLVDESDTVTVPPVDVDVVDTTGAGDAFTAGLIHAWLLSDLPAERAGRFAAAVAAYNCTSVGAREDLPTREDALALLDDR